jgi:mannose-6-phosphate isomerase-like protein (cupin superfamily)
MPELIGEPSRVTAAGEPPKLIDEYVGRVNSAEARVSIAHMRSPSGWAEPGQRPEFGEFTVVLRGALLVEYDGGQLTVQAGQAGHAPAASARGSPRCTRFDPREPGQMGRLWVRTCAQGK